MQNPDVETADPATWAIIEAFEKANPDIKVTVSGEAVAEHLQKLSIAAQSDTLPDIFWVYKSTAEEMQEAGKLLDLAPVLDELGLTDSFPESTIANFSAGEVIYGVPVQGLLTGLWVNKKILADNGVEMPVTFDDLLNAAETLSAKGITTISNGANQSSFSVWSFLSISTASATRRRSMGILDGSERYANDDFLRLYEHIAELRDAGAFASNVSTQTYQQAVDQFTAATPRCSTPASGHPAPSRSRRRTRHRILDRPAVRRRRRRAEHHHERRIRARSRWAPRSRMTTNKLDAVTKFLAFYYGDEAQQILVDNGQPPVTTYEPEVDPAKQSALKAALDAATADGVTSPQSQPDLLVPTPVANAMYDSIYGVIQDQLTPEAALELVQKALDASSDRAGRRPGAPAPPITPTRRSETRSHTMIWISSRWKILLMLAPAIIVFTMFVVYPVHLLGRVQLHQLPGLRRTDMDRRRQLHRPLQRSVLLAGVAEHDRDPGRQPRILIPASFALALLLQRAIAGGRRLRALVFGPAIIAPILVGLIWVFILDPKIGLLNRVLGAFGILRSSGSGATTLTPISVSIVFIWSSIGFAMTIFYAGLQLLPADVIEASALDGATGWQQVWHIKIPMMSETFAIVTILMITNVFKIFELVYMLTGGGPVHRSETLVSYMYFVTFTNQQYGLRHGDSRSSSRSWARRLDRLPGVYADGERQTTP